MSGQQLRKDLMIVESGPYCVGIYVEVSGPLFRNNHFWYQERELCNVKVFNIIYGKKATVDHRQLERPTGAELQKPTVYKIHAGYSTVLRGFLWEIELMYDDSVQEHNCLF
jgi:hypothetical protein